MPFRVFVRRHEKTAKGPDGKKLDEPTPEGRLAAVRRGEALAQRLPTYTLNAYHSDAQRTQIAARAWLEGFGYTASLIDYATRREPRLNGYSGSITPEQNAAMRSMEPLESLKHMTDTHPETLEKGAKGIADFLRSNIARNDKYRSGSICVGHFPTLDAACLVMLGKPITPDNILETTGMFKEGEGFDVTARKTPSGIYTLEITVNGKQFEAQYKQ